ncbi:protein bicaudal C homolog 1 isoform X1 [Ananas comosus]|uniref:Protein bicaudal C homolog 1 isoform X1 n=1 Tax=Ananas comosus TaxID=4615 RepID=A0A6P5GQB9_ANACO|nr:protein bicaudal C homolog 1 isoform X1 [Ananas comosus]XP_020110847.1 protein bicaudal C homolog 1 isoform X1 [Ananas comosus]
MSSRPRVTITLGRSGQVVKKGPLSDLSHSDDMPSAGDKRSIRERLGSNMDESDSYGSLYKNKRQRLESHASRFSNRDLDYDDQLSIWEDRRVARGDLRLKLMEKSLSQRRNAGAGKANSNGVDLRERLSRNTQSSSRYDTRQGAPRSRESGVVVRRIPPARSADDLLQLDSVKTSYTSWRSDGLRRSSPDRHLSASRAISPPRSYGEMRMRPTLRSLGTSRPSSMLTKDVPSASRSAAYMSNPSAPLDAKRPVVPSLPAGNIVQKSSFTTEEPLTVSGLLHSIGLGKYAILFQAEEVDMAALRQMGDGDLKELGIPMGPRKKILLAMLSYSKQRQR